MAKPELGSKRQCLTCGAKFFDFSRDPIVCPKCGAVFQAAPLPRSPTRPQPAAEEAEQEPGTPEMVSLEDADPAEEKAVVAGDEVEIEEPGEGDDDDAFLEEEEGDSDDVADLIDGDLEDDEET